LSAGAFSDHQLNSGQAEVPIGRPARSNPPVRDHDEPVCVGKRNLLIGELPGEPRRFGQGITIERLYREDCKCLDEAEESYGADGLRRSREPRSPGVADRKRAF
jgi:hypothetical protein